MSEQSFDSTGAFGDDESLMESVLDQLEHARINGENPDIRVFCKNFPELIEAIKLKDFARNRSDSCHQSGIDRQPSSVMLADVSSPALVQSSTKYDALQHMAEGGLGVVYSANDVVLGRKVAIKLIQPRLSNDSIYRQQFQIEKEITGGLEHPGTVPMYASGQTSEGHPFYVMRFIEGETLADAAKGLHRQRQLRVEDFAGLQFRDLLARFAMVCKTIAYAHNRGVLHRDIKPANVMLGRFGETLVIDWGLAQRIRQENRDLSTGEPSLKISSGSDIGTSSKRIEGTLPYMSPEQASGSEQLTAASDIFSLGSTLYQLLSGRLPYEGSDAAAVLGLVTKNRHVPLVEVNRVIPRSLRAICEKAMSTQPRDRYASALELAHDLECWLADEPVSVVPDTKRRAIGRWLRRHRAAAQLLAMTLFMLVVVSAIAAVGFERLAEREHQAFLESEKAHGSSMAMAAKFAASTVASEIDVRWRILETEATDMELVSLLEDAERAETASRSVIHERSLAWLGRRFDKHQETTMATSWLICDSNGVQMGRWPESNTIGQNFAFRDYFHGKGYDNRREDASEVEPLESVHLSMVFHSEAIHEDMVAFSVPIWSAEVGSAPQRVLGVLAMTVAVGEFRVLESELAGDQVAVLVDTREGTNDGETKAGRILHHPRLTGPPTNSEPYRLPRAVIPNRSPAMPSSSAGSSPTVVGPSLFQFRDPLSTPPGAEQSAAFAPVLIRGRADSTADTGWFVIVHAQTD